MEHMTKICGTAVQGINDRRLCSFLKEFYNFLNFEIKDP